MLRVCVSGTFRRITGVKKVILSAHNKAKLWRELEGFCVFIPVCLLERFRQKGKNPDFSHVFALFC